MLLNMHTLHKEKQFLTILERRKYAFKDLRNVHCHNILRSA